MKKVLSLLFMAAILAPNLAFADGGMFPGFNYREKVYLPSQKAVIAWDGGEETLILSTKVGVENLANLAWIIPVPSKTKPEIEEGDIEIFYDLADLFTLARKAPGFGAGVGLKAPQEVTVVEFKKVDIYDITTLKATDAQALVDWLNENGYVVSESAVPVLQEYCDQEDFYFIANKINLANKYKNLTITDNDRICAKAVIGHTPRTFGRTSQPDISWALGAFKECQDAHPEAVQVLVELKQGVATPIKIQFQPKTPFYPLKISSLNDGSTKIDVYLFSETPIEDKSGVLAASQMTENTSLFKNNYGLGQKYITYLTYSGDLKDLNSDSWFEPTKYNSSLDPNYISLKERVFGLFSSGLYTLVYFAVPIAILIFAGIGFIVVMKKIIAKFRKT